MFPPIEPHDSGMLDVGDGDRVYWEVVGDPEGKPAVFAHGGPGGGCTEKHRRWFDPAKYRAVLFDQRNCGRSTPHAADPGVDLSANTTQNLVADMERLREHLGIDRWLVSGGSWGSTLALAYAQAHPSRVTELVIIDVTTTRRREIEWLYHGVGRYFPEARQRFCAVAPGAPIGEVLSTYDRLLADPATQRSAAAEWLRWEDTVISLEPHADLVEHPLDAAELCFARLCAHYFSRGAFLEEGILLREAGKLAGIPGVLIHGRHDLSSPLDTAWDLAQAWPDATLEVIADSGHSASPTMRNRLLRAFAEFA
ncbi:prolyl aminopeptidase [Actinokineospora fastidiosa]|uniref:Proline iminopeptidase n=1 Tax=Actinokineospora fastidiosa TaxID=1816 RepID=A0A918LFG3_9PSEU|nr:prolyl aminopeptidase [Actinokineospora fastidiosa]GGS41594.1 proline iminopeptidase [Actinokineospora fastidiosa]